MDWIMLFLLAVVSFGQCKEMHMTCKRIREFVDGHNARRLLLAEGKLPGHPAASEMQKLVWDEELYEKAVKWAAIQERNVRFHSHNPDRTVPSGRFTTSENLYWYSTTDRHHNLHPADALDAWFNENKNFAFQPLHRGHFYSGAPEIGHYSQMVWSDSLYVGCAMSKKSERGWHHFFVNCNYGPQGNYLGQTPYKTEGGASHKLICTHNNCNQPYGKNCSNTTRKKYLRVLWLK